MQPSADTSEEPVTETPTLPEQQQTQTASSSASEPPRAAPSTLSFAYSSHIPYSTYEQSLLEQAPFAFPSLDAFAERESILRSQDKQLRKKKEEKVMKQQGKNEFLSPATVKSDYASIPSIGYHPERGVGNTFFLSIRSGIKEEVDSALPVILDYSRRDGPPSDFTVYPGSIEALLGLADMWLEDWEEHQQRSEQGGEGEWLQGQDEADHERWALSALLAIRNACMAHDKVCRLLVGVRGKYTAEDLAKLRNAPGINGSSATLPYLPPRILLFMSKILRRQVIRDLAMRMPEMLLYIMDILILILPCVLHTIDRSPPSSPVDGNGNSKSAVPAVEVTSVETDKAEDTLQQTGQLLRDIITDSIPALFSKTSDLAVIKACIQIFIAIPANLLPVDEIVDRLATFLVLTPSQHEQTPWPRELFLQSLGLLYHITSNSSLATTTLKRQDLDGLLRILIGLTRYGTKPLYKQMRTHGPLGRIQEISPIIGVGAMTNVKGTEAAGKWIAPSLPDDDGEDLTGENVGLGPKIVLDTRIEQRIRSMREPERSYAWMRECLMYQPQSYMTQVTFWQAYQKFVATDPNGPAIPPPAVAGDVIKAATAVFPGAAAMVMREDAQGRPIQPKFVINGLRFKRSLGRRRNYQCKWQGCADRLGSMSNAELLGHIRTTHLAGPTRPDGTARPVKCRWALCTCDNATSTHMMTHLPFPIDPTKVPEPKRVIIHPDDPAVKIYSGISGFQTDWRRVPPLPHLSTISNMQQGFSNSDIVHPLSYLGLEFPADKTGQPMQEGYYACMVLKNLARALRDDIERAGSEESLDMEHDGYDLGEGGIQDRGLSSRNRKKRKLDRLGAFGLPAPPGLLEGSYIDPILQNANGTDDKQSNGEVSADPVVPLDRENRQRARLAFRSIVQEPVLQMLEQSGGEVPKRLVECLGF